MAVLSAVALIFFEGDLSMKANIHTAGHEEKDIILSIGMIVKNEEKVLGRCLESLQPLMKQIPSELIIADTGSTDSTVEIARKYTDNVFHFEWINDFAAARNSTLEKARGQWFLFIDADEYLDDDIGEIVHFFNIPELRSKYKTLEIMVRSYVDKEKTNYNDGCLARFHRIDDPEDKVRFIGSVHEGIWLRYPLGYFSTILHHTGYCFESERQNVRKKNRNLALMREEYKKNPRDLRMLSHLIDGCSFEKEECEKYIAEALEIIDNDRRNLYSNVVYMQAISHYQNSRPEYALELCNKYCKTLDDHQKYVATVAVILIKSKILSALARYEESYASFKLYMELYEKFINDELDITDSSAHPIFGTTKSEYVRNVFFAALTLKNLKRYDEAFALLNQFDLDDIQDENFKEYLGTLRELCTEKKDYKQLADYYNRLYHLDDNNRKSLALYMMESIYYSLNTNEERLNFAKDIIDCGLNTPYAELMKLVIIQEDSDVFRKKLSAFIDSIDDWTDGYSEAIYMAVRYKLDISSAVDKMKSNECRAKIENIAASNDDFAKLVLAYGIPDAYTVSIKRFYWITSLYEKASYYTYGMTDSDKLRLYNTFILLLGDYVSNIYNSELFNDDDIEVLPNLHKFGYYMKQANYALSNDDKILYIKNMKKALVNCESMKEIVELLLNQFKIKNI